MSDLGSVPEWDDVVVGAGSAGAVLAARLAERPERRVLLIEAGPDPSGPGGPPNTRGMPVVTGYNWDYTAQVGADPSGRRSPYPLGKLVGGTSAINGAIALRGLAQDFRTWAEMGNPEWAWDQVLPEYLAIEADADHKGAAHGTDGPLPIGRAGPADLGPLSAGFLQACRALGWTGLPDLNAGSQPGAGPIPTNGLGQHRMSTVDTHLAPARDRPNLTVRERCPVSRVLLDGDRVTGVELVRAGRPERVAARRVTLAAGGVATPLILQRSGIGDPKALSAAGITPRIELAGVGENLIDHPAVPIWVLPGPGVCRAGQPWYQVMARAASSGATPDLGIFLASDIETANLPEAGGALGGRIAAMVSAVLLSPDSRGRVRPRSPEPEDAPDIRLGLISAPGDQERLMQAIRLAWSVVRAPAFAALLRGPVAWTDRMVRDDTLLRQALARWTVPLFHAAGTARMGPADDPGAVVDQRCRVHRVRGLQVCDASVMPSYVSAPPFLSCAVIAERVARWSD